MSRKSEESVGGSYVAYRVQSISSELLALVPHAAEWQEANSNGPLTAYGRNRKPRLRSRKRGEFKGLRTSRSCRRPSTEEERKAKRPD